MEGIQEIKLPSAQGTLIADPRHLNLPRPFRRSTGWLMDSRGRGTLRQYKALSPARWSEVNGASAGVWKLCTSTQFMQ